MEFKPMKGFHNVNTLPNEDSDYSITFVPSGFKGLWIKVFELYDYTLNVIYASNEENDKLNKENEKE